MSDIHNIKIILIGETGVGKSSIIQRYLKNKFDSGSMPTIGIDYNSKNI
jgi:GTPase SAR1 family protein